MGSKNSWVQVFGSQIGTPNRIRDYFIRISKRNRVFYYRIFMHIDSHWTMTHGPWVMVTKYKALFLTIILDFYLRICCIKFAYLRVIEVLCLRVRSSYSASMFDLVRHRFKKCNRLKIMSELQLLFIQKCSNSYSLFTHLQVITSIVHFRATII